MSANTTPTPTRHTSGAGRVLGGRYTLLTPIAQGGMGEVWKARDRVSGHIVAAKVLRPELSGEELSLSRLRLEARNSMSISHPNIANTQDSGQEDGIGWIIMELVEGYPLTDYLRGGSRIEPEYLMPILVQVAMALGAAARAGVVHRDIKPANILVRPDGMVKLTDFGISRATGQVNLTAAGMVMGTAQYLPPEQAMGEVATPIGDLYALGVIAYEAAAGRRPFTGETQVDIAFAHVNDPVPPLPDFVPEPLVDVILHLLEKDPAKRPDSGSAAVREIAAAAKAMGISVSPCPLPLPKSAHRPAAVKTPVQPSVPIIAPVRHLTRRTLPDEMLRPPSGLTPQVRERSEHLPVLDEAVTVAPSSSPLPLTPRRRTVERGEESAHAPAPTIPRTAQAPRDVETTTTAPRAEASTAVPAQPEMDSRAALAERLRSRAQARQEADAAEERRREEERRAQEEERIRLQAQRARREEERRAHEAERARSESERSRAPRVYGTVPQRRASASRSSSAPRTSSASRASSTPTPRRSVFDESRGTVKNGPRWHSLDARSAQKVPTPAKTKYSRSVVAPPIPLGRKVVRALIVALIVIALIALAAITIRNMLGSLIPTAGSTVIEEVRTWQSPWPTV